MVVVDGGIKIWCGGGGGGGGGEKWWGGGGGGGEQIFGWCGEIPPSPK